jgi:hypothetical protein
VDGAGVMTTGASITSTVFSLIPKVYHTYTGHRKTHTMDHGHEMCKAYPEYILVRKKSTSTSAPPYDFAGDPRRGYTEARSPAEGGRSVLCGAKAERSRLAEGGRSPRA